MKKDIVKLICMIDKSISMKGREKQVLKTYNSLIEEYKRFEEKCFVTTCLFAEKINMLCLQNEISFVKPLTERDYYIEGSTALFDAVKTSSYLEEILEKVKTKRYTHSRLRRIGQRSILHQLREHRTPRTNGLHWVHAAVDLPERVWPELQRAGASTKIM